MAAIEFPHPYPFCVNKRVVLLPLPFTQRLADTIAYACECTTAFGSLIH